MKNRYKKRSGNRTDAEENTHHIRYPLRYTRSGMIYMDSSDNCDAVVDAMLDTGYTEEFCLSIDWDLSFITRLMKAGFLVMSDSFMDEDEQGRVFKRDIILPKLHLVRSVLLFSELHIKKSVRSGLNRYELRFNTDFDLIVNKCLAVHGDGWLTSSLVKTLNDLRETVPKDGALHGPPRPVSFGIYRDGELKAGEFGIMSGRVYTSYSGYREENNSGTVQMILMIRWLEEQGFAFLDFGMPLDYKTALGARNIDPETFVNLWRKAQDVV